LESSSLMSSKEAHLQYPTWACTGSSNLLLSSTLHR